MHGLLYQKPKRDAERSSGGTKFFKGKKVNRPTEENFTVLTNSKGGDLKIGAVKLYWNSKGACFWYRVYKKHGSRIETSWV